MNIKQEDSSFRKISAKYVYLPLWFISYPYQGKEYVFAMNGQTGKVIGTPPLSQLKTTGWFALISGIIFAILLAGGLLL